MDAASWLASLFKAMPIADLRKHIRALRRDPDSVHGYLVAGRSIAATGRAALHVAELAMQDREMLRRNRHDIVLELRSRAKANPESGPTGSVNILSWLGNKNPAWYAVFSYSSPDPREPWFCSLDTEAQRLVLLLVAAALETEPT